MVVCLPSFSFRWASLPTSSRLPGRIHVQQCACCPTETPSYFFPVSLSCSSLVNCVEEQRGTVKTNEMYRTYIWWGVLLYRPAILSHSTDLGRPLHCLPSQAHTLLNCGAGQYACSKRNKIRGTTPYRYQLAGMALQKPAPAGEVAHRIDHPSLQRTGRQTLSASRPALRWTEN
jgi:hypothetical protein